MPPFPLPVSHFLCFVLVLSRLSTSSGLRTLAECVGPLRTASGCDPGVQQPRAAPVPSLSRARPLGGWGVPRANSRFGLSRSTPLRCEVISEGQEAHAWRSHACRQPSRAGQPNESDSQRELWKAEDSDDGWRRGEAMPSEGARGLDSNANGFTGGQHSAFLSSPPTGSLNAVSLTSSSRATFLSTQVLRSSPSRFSSSCSFGLPPFPVSRAATPFAPGFFSIPVYSASSCAHVCALPLSCSFAHAAGSSLHRGDWLTAGSPAHRRVTSGAQFGASEGPGLPLPQLPPSCLLRRCLASSRASTGGDAEHARLLKNFQQEFAQLQSLLPSSLPPQRPGTSPGAPAEGGAVGAAEAATGAACAASAASGASGGLPSLQDLVARVQREGGVPKLAPKVQKELEDVIDGLCKDTDVSNDNLVRRLTSLVKSGAFGKTLQGVYEAEERAQDEAEEAQRVREAADGFNPRDLASALRKATADPAARKVAQAIMSAGNAPTPAGEGPQSASAAAEGGGAQRSDASAESRRDAEDQRLREASNNFSREAPEKGAESIKSEGDLFDIIRGSTKQYLEQLNMKPVPPGQSRLDDKTVIHWKEETDILQVWIPLPPDYIRESISVSTARARLRVSCRVRGTTQGVGQPTEDDVVIVDRQMKGYMVSADTHWTIASYPLKPRTGEATAAETQQHFLHAVGPKRGDSRRIWGDLFGEPPSREEWMLHNDERFTELDGTKPPPPHVLKHVPELEQPEVKQFIEAFHKMGEEADDSKE
ncbi:hypothetical protein BESB_062630 [Besnoitia besnoiti]|uniref:CS domain-containing protein n=1 Tax=Besnoitia besnoiti TaxID=94643 RepID=A0A2A9MHF1_BESBE|nr:hypothetical protein BESB_062630 [Besnoitia besnoiti]PFH35376.1 hypothetical protein BESB_062630 [Besnoitia besnoiti]